MLSAFLQERGYASLTEIVNTFGISVSTARRDLDEMQQKGIVRRTHGGAFHVEAREHPLDYSKREAKNVPEKQAIGALAASLIRDGETVLLDGGTTTFEVAARLRGRRIQVVTNSLPIATMMSKKSESEVVFLGGSIMPSTGVVLGRWAEDMLRSLHVNRAIIGVAGVMEDGLYNANLMMVELERLMIQAADQLIVVVDHSKFGRRSLVRLCELSVMDHLITDTGTENRWLDTVKSHGVQVHVAEAERAEADDNRAYNASGN